MNQHQKDIVETIKLLSRTKKFNEVKNKNSLDTVPVHIVFAKKASIEPKMDTDTFLECLDDLEEYGYIKIWHMVHSANLSPEDFSKFENNESLEQALRSEVSNSKHFFNIGMDRKDVEWMLTTITEHGDSIAIIDVRRNIKVLLNLLRDGRPFEKVALAGRLSLKDGILHIGKRNINLEKTARIPQYKSILEFIFDFSPHLTHNFENIREYQGVGGLEDRQYKQHCYDFNKRLQKDYNITDFLTVTEHSVKVNPKYSNT